MKILVINAGSSSLKYQLIDMQNETAILKGVCERIGLEGGTLTQKNAQKKELVLNQDMKNHTEAIQLVLKAMVDKEFGAISSISEISAVGHRVLHSGEDFKASVLIDGDVVRICEKNAELGPLHMPGNIACIKSCAQVMPNVPMVAVFDTTFHSTMPAKASSLPKWSMWLSARTLTTKLAASRAISRLNSYVRKWPQAAP